jgi:hypothetical protein
METVSGYFEKAYVLNRIMDHYPVERFDVKIGYGGYEVCKYRLIGNTDIVSKECSVLCFR